MLHLKMLWNKELRSYSRFKPGVVGEREGWGERALQARKRNRRQRHLVRQRRCSPPAIDLPSRS